MLHPLVHEFIILCAANADTETARRKKAYMKHRYNFFGIFQPQRTILQNMIFNKYTLLTMDELSSIVQALWHQEKRECLYAAIDLLKMHKKLWDKSTLALFEHCIINHSWWDTIDDLAAHCVGHLCTQYPELQPIMDQWIEHDNMWLRRTALIFQLKYKTKTDTFRLFGYCQKRMHEKEFFIRKAIGWALREYSKTDPIAVLQFVTKHHEHLAPLSKREAIRRIPASLKQELPSTLTT